MFLSSFLGWSYFSRVWSLRVLLFSFVMWDQSNARSLPPLPRQGPSVYSIQGPVNYDASQCGSRKQALCPTLYEDQTLLPLLQSGGSFPGPREFHCAYVLAIHLHTREDPLAYCIVFLLCFSLLSNTLFWKFWLPGSPSAFSFVFLPPGMCKQGLDLPPCCGCRKLISLQTRAIIGSLPCLPSFPVLHFLMSTVWQPLVFTYFVHVVSVSSGRENLVVVIPSWLEVNVQNRPVFSVSFVKIFANVFTCETQMPIKL